VEKTGVIGADLEAEAWSRIAQSKGELGSQWLRGQEVGILLPLEKKKTNTGRRGKGENAV